MVPGPQVWFRSPWKEVVAMLLGFLGLDPWQVVVVVVGAVVLVVALIAKMKKGAGSSGPGAQ